MCQVLTGEIPFVNLLRDVLVVGASTTGERPSRPLQNDLITDEIWKMMGRGWSADPAMRPSMEEFRDFVGIFSTVQCGSV